MLPLSAACLLHLGHWTLKKKKKKKNPLEMAWLLKNHKELNRIMSIWKQSLRGIKGQKDFTPACWELVNIQPVLWVYSRFRKEARAGWKMCNIQWICQSFSSTLSAVSCRNAFLFMKPILHSHDTAYLHFLGVSDLGKMAMKLQLCVSVPRMHRQRGFYLNQCGTNE